MFKVPSVYEIFIRDIKPTTNSEVKGRPQILAVAVRLAIDHRPGPTQLLRYALYYTSMLRLVNNKLQYYSCKNRRPHSVSILSADFQSKHSSFDKTSCCQNYCNRIRFPWRTLNNYTSNYSARKVEEAVYCRHQFYINAITKAKNTSTESDKNRNKRIWAF